MQQNKQKHATATIEKQKRNKENYYNIVFLYNC